MLYQSDLQSTRVLIVYQNDILSGWCIKNMKKSIFKKLQEMKNNNSILKYTIPKRYFVRLVYMVYQSDL